MRWRNQIQRINLSRHTHAPLSLLLILVAILSHGDASRPVDPLRNATTKSPAGLVALPCDQTGDIRAAHARYCQGEGRNWVTPTALDVLRQGSARLARAYPQAHITYMDASWPSGVRPMPPHVSHGDGREIDIALFYTDASGKPLASPPIPIGYGAFEPPLPGEPRPCAITSRSGAFSDPPASRTWRLDEARTRALIVALLADARVQRILIEPHLEQRLGFAGNARVRFPGCYAMRHDSHFHVDIKRDVP